MGDRKIKIGILIAPTDFPYSNKIIKGILKRTTNVDTTIFCYMLNYDTLDQSFHNDVLKLVDKKSIDGLIISGSLSHQITKQEFYNFCDSLGNIPIVTISVKFKNIFGIQPDNSIGMRQLMTHLLDEHKYKKIAFIGGPIGQQESEIRKRIFIEEMQKRDLKINNDWITHGNYWLQSGKAATKKFLQNGRPDFDGIVVANDEMAMAAIKELEKSGYMVPGDFFVTGFDDFYSRILTTVRQPVVKQAVKAVEYILSKIENEFIQEDVSIPTSLVIRSSCGCTPLNRLSSNKSYMILKEKVATWLMTINNAFTNSLETKNDTFFLNEIRNILSENITSDTGALWQIIQTELRLNVMPQYVKKGLQTEAGMLLDQGSLLIIEHPFNKESDNTFNSLTQTSLLRSFNEALANTLYMNDINSILEAYLPQMGFNSCYLSLYDNAEKNVEIACLKFAYNKNGRINIPNEGIYFNSKELLPNTYNSAIDESELLVVETLFNQNNLLGFILLSTNLKGIKISNEVSVHISNAIQGVIILNESDNTKKQIIQSEKMAALGSLVAGIAHEINTPIGIGITAASDLKTRTEKIYEKHTSNNLSKLEFDNFMKIVTEESFLIKNNLLRAGDLIRSFKKIAVDQSHDKSRLFSLEDYLNDIVLSFHPQLKHKKHKCNVICQKDIQLFGPPGSIAQIFSNLITNSIVHGFENISNGIISIYCNIKKPNIIIDYKDNGKGISKDALTHIYEPFYTTKFGYGGSGLGLNIVFTQIVQIWKGEIKCFSNLNKGIHFQIKLPYNIDKKTDLPTLN